ncbi:MAG TPA: arginine--tRNA ligase [Blastocatellia bacterium]|nr:arginine--tRNA ligase [Blastocatellia bacterium]
MLDILTLITQALTSVFPGVPDKKIIIRQTPDPQMGDLGINVLPIAKALGEESLQVAGRAAEALRQLAYVRGAEIKGPFVNVFLYRQPLIADLCNKVREDEFYGSGKTGAGHPALIEHTSINPNASPHVGRGRNALIGDSLSRLFRFEQYDLEVHYYVNDLGKQIALLVMECRGKDNISFGDMLALYVAANERAKADPAFEQQAFDLLRRFEEHDEEVVREFLDRTGACLAGQLQVMSRLGIRYDFFDRESDFVHDPELDVIIEKLRQRGALFNDEHGREVVDLKKLGFQAQEGQYFVLRRANGSSMYGYRDIAYTLYKLRRCPESNIVVLGQDHWLYFSQLGTILQVADIKPPELVTYSHILLKEGKMSTRQGNVILLEDFLDEAIARSRERVNESCPEMDEAERAEIARRVGVGAVKFSILRVAPQSNVIFDWEQALTFEGDSAPYIQYCCTRISSILRRYGQEVGRVEDMEFAVGDEEWQLAYGLSELPNIIRSALAKRNPGILANYALDIAKSFNRFYRECPVLQADSPDQRTLRLNLCVSTYKVLFTVLDLLGIEVPERM